VTLLYVGKDVCVLAQSANMLPSKVPDIQGKSITFQEKTMTKLRKMSMALVLALMLAPSALAGITDYPPAPPPPPPSPTATGTIGTGPSDAQPVAASDLVVDVALNLLQSMLLAF
jgi:hypothetical protein